MSNITTKSIVHTYQRGKTCHREEQKVGVFIGGEMKMYKADSAKRKASEAETERRIVFIASDASTDRDGEVVDIKTFVLPLKDGGKVRVADLTGNEAVDIPLLTDHDGYAVDKVIGSVRKAEYIEGQLVFTAGIANTKRAQELLKLLEAGHLNNAFSIGWTGGEYHRETRSFTAGEIIEVSLVTRGCNPEARLIDIKNNNAERNDMAKDTSVKNTTKDVEKPEAEAPVAEAPAEAETETKAETAEQNSNVETTDKQTTSDTEQKAEKNEITNNKEKENENAVGDGADKGADTGAEKAQTPTSPELSTPAETIAKRASENGAKGVAEAEADAEAMEARAEYQAGLRADRAEAEAEAERERKRPSLQGKSFATKELWIKSKEVEHFMLNGQEYIKLKLNNKGEYMNETTNNETIAKAQVEKPSQKIVVKDNSKKWLDTKEANHTFAKFIVDNYGQSNAVIMKKWAEFLRTKAVEGMEETGSIKGDEILPTTIQQTFFKVWNDKSGLLSYLRPSRLLQGSAYAALSKSHAQGHKKGEKKDNMELETVRRDYKAKIVFARMPIDLQDLIDDTTGELMLLRSELLADMLYNDTAKAIVVGNGDKSSGKGFFDEGGRGLYPMLADLETAVKKKGQPSTSDEKYADAVAVNVENVDADNDWDKLVKTTRALKGKGQKIVLVAPGYISSLMTLKAKGDGQYFFNPGSDFEKMLNCKIFEFDFMAESDIATKYEVLAFNAGSYIYATGSDMMRTAFDTEYNKDILLHEKAMAGTLFGRDVFAGYASAENEQE